MSRRQVRNLNGSTFGARLREARESAALTQEKLAREIDVTLRTIQRWEDDNSPSEPRGSQVMTLALRLGVDATDLYPPSEEAA